MMTRSALVIPMLVILLLAWSAPAPSLAQESTPTAPEGSTTLCAEVTPRDTTFLQSLPGTPQAQQDAAAASPTASPTPFAMPEGAAADATAVAEVTDLYQLLIACINAGDFLRVSALYSEEYLIQKFDAETLAMLDATPVPTEATTQTTLGGVLDVRLLDDGRLVALVTTQNPTAGEVLLFAILDRDGDQLRIDDEQVVASALPASPETGTPTG